MTGIDDDWKMRNGLEHRYSGDVERVARSGFEGTNAPLTQNDLKVPGQRDYLCRTQKLFQRRRHASFQENRASATAKSLEQSEVLHAAGANLHDVGIFCDEIDVFLAHDFGDDGKASFFASFAQEFEAFYS